MFLFKIAWRNVWRNKVRSLVVIASIITGIFAGVFTIAFSYGLNNQRTEVMLNSMVSHIQIHDSLFNEEMTVSEVIDARDLDKILQNDTRIAAYCKRAVTQGMVQTANNGGGVMIQGIDPEAEKKVTDMYTKLVEGEYMTGTKKNPVVIGQKLAEKLKVGLKKYIVLTFQDAQGEVVSGRFKVVGIYKSISSKIDETLVFVNIKDAQKLLGIGNNFHEVAIVLNDVNQAKTVAHSLQKQLPTVLVEPWQEVSPELGYADETMALSLYIIMGIILLALIGGIVNTMLMAVLERTRELGMILCVGMNKTKVFTMIMLETIMLSLIGGPIGLLLGYGLTSYFEKTGIPLKGLEQGMEAFGIGTVVYPHIDLSQIMQIVVMVLVTALLSAIVPGIRAMKLKPAEAVRAI